MKYDLSVVVTRAKLLLLLLLAFMTPCEGPLLLGSPRKKEQNGCTDVWDGVHVCCRAGSGSGVCLMVSLLPSSIIPKLKPR